MNQAAILSIHKLSFWQSEQLIFQNLSWALKPQQWTCLLGQSGIGKSTLLGLLAGLPFEKAKIEGHFTTSPDLAYLGQEDDLLPWLTVFENATLSTRLRSHSKEDKERIQQRCLDLLEKVGLKTRLNDYPRQLSGGMRQRLALVRTLAEDKSIILMDEPFSHLDAITRYQMQNLALTLLKGKTVLFITHDPEEALRLADQIDLLRGHPASFETLATFDTPGPRELTTPYLRDLQQYCYQSMLLHHTSLQGKDS